MINKKVKAAIKITLPVIFITYMSCITFFTHSHIVNGVTIVHSHPYATDNNNEPRHAHTGTELQLIHTLSTFFIAGLIAFPILLGIFRTKQIVFRGKPCLFILENHRQGIYLLRPPPVL